MPLDAHFLDIAHHAFDPGMGTEHAAPLLYSMVRMQRPSSVLCVGLGYSTLFVLQALADNRTEAQHDARVAAGTLTDPARHEVLHPGYDHAGHAAHLHGIDDFSEDEPRLQRFLQILARLNLAPLFTLHRCRFQDVRLPAEASPFGFMWLDCGHQLDYPDLLNRFWPLLDADGGLAAIHYTHVDVDVPDVDVPDGGATAKVVIPGPCANALRRQQLQAGMGAGFELLSLVEPHKHRQGSVTLLRRLDEVDACRPASLQQEQQAMYGSSPHDLIDLNRR
jgi:predicted O-methyltransferase YrrM